MTDIVLMTEAEAAQAAAPVADAGLGALRTERGNLPLDSVDIRAEVTGLTGRVELTQDFVNAFDTPLEATYVFPMPDRAAVTGMRMTAAGRVVEAELKERAQARADYDRAISAGQRASIAEEERPDILPGERVSVALTLVCPLSYEDGTATFRFPLVVAPRYIPGTPLPGAAVGDGYAPDTDAVPDASRITPPVLLPGFPNPVRLSIQVDLDPAGLELTEVRSSLHAITAGAGRIAIRPGERLDRDFVLRLRYGGAERTDALVLVADKRRPAGPSQVPVHDPDGSGEGTFQLTVLPPADASPARPRDVVLVLDRSGSMQGWKMVAARRAAARIVDTLTTGDRFAVLSFDDRVEHPDGLPGGLVDATDRHRFRAVEHLARVDARGGTALLAPLREALSLLSPVEGRDPVLVLVTDGQVGNEDHILSQLTGQLRGVRVHTVGIDRAVNAGFLGRLAGLGGGRCELVESEDRLDEAMAAIHRRVAAPVVSRLDLVPDGLVLLDDSLAPARVPDLFPGVALVVAGRYRGASGGLTLRGTTRDGRPWSATVTGQRRDAPAVTAQWARAHVRDLEDRYVAGFAGAELEKRIVDTSLRFGVLCRFTAYVAVDSRVVAEGGEPHRVVQPVEAPSGWDMLQVQAPPMVAAAMTVPDPGGAADHAAPGLAPRAPLPPSAVPPPSPAPWRAAAPQGRASGRERAARAEEMPVPSELDAAREQAGDEVRRLGEAAGRAPHERWELLADLASRLRALVRHLSQRGVPESRYAPLRDLAELLDAGGELDPLWNRAVQVLQDFTGQRQPDRPFWKRS
jgi:Ca-activated chloride channel homolog